jgi:uncharacterized membrane protein YwaF
MVVVYAAVVGAIDAALHTNYMYLCQKPGSETVLNVFGPWPWYLFAAAALTLLLFEVLWLAARKSLD